MSKQETQIIKGIAILMMPFLHLFNNTMTKELNNNLLMCTDLHHEDDVKMGLIDEWYRTYFCNLAVAIKKDQSLKQNNNLN